MRLIDADWLMVKIEQWRDQIVDMYGRDDEYADCLAEVVMKIEDAPTADVPNRKNGEWVRIPGVWVDGEYYPSRLRCPYCRHYIRVGEDKNFCPNCGSMMKGVKDASLH